LGGRDPLARLIAEIDRRRTLLVLDNLEHLLDGVQAFRLGALIEVCPRLTIVATSRARLRLQPEIVYPVEPLPLPSEGAPFAEVWATPSVRPFVDRAKAAGGAIGAGDVETVAAIARRLDGLPLAIELAAARLLTDGTPARLLARLEQRLPVLTD